MSEFYESTNMEICQEISIETVISKYNQIKKMLHTLLSFFEMFEDDFYLTIPDIQNFLTFHNIIDLSYIFRSYYLLQNHDMLESADYILQRTMITDDILDEDLYMYCKAFILIKINEEPHKHEELFDNILDISEFHTHYLNGHLTNVINMIEFEDSFNTLSI